MPDRADFLMPPVPAPRRNNRQDKIQRDEKVDVHGAVSYLEEAERGAVALTESVREFAASAQALLQCGLTERAIVILVHDLCPNAANGKEISQDTVQRVLRAAARASEHLEQQSSGGRR